MTTPAFLYRILLFLMLFFLCVPSAWAQQTIDWAKVHTLCIEMMNEMYNLRFPEAEQKAAAVIATAPSDPRGYFFRAMIHYYQCTFNQDEKGKKNDYSKFLGSAAKVETVCDQLLKYNENDSKAKFYKGGIVGYRGLLRFMSNEDLMKAVWDGRDAFNLLTEATEDDPNNADAQFGLGLFKYLLTQAPDWVKPYIKLAGLKGDRVQGLTMMEKAAVNGVYARSEARRWLSNFYAGLDPYKSRGAAHLKILADQYPQSWYLRQQLGRYYLGNLRNATDAIPQFQKLLALAPNARILSPNEVGSMACFYMALAQYYKNDYTNAFANFKRVIDEFKDDDYISEAQYYCGSILEQQGKRDQAVSCYKLSKNDDAKERLAKPMSAVDKQLVAISNSFRGGDDAAAIQAAETLVASGDANADEKAQALYFAGRAYQELKNWQKSEERFWQVVKLNAPTEKWSVPYSYWRIAQLMVKQKRNDEAKKYFNQSLEYSGYDGEKGLQSSVKRELDQLD